MANTYNNLYLDIRTRLRQAGIEGAQLEARELVSYAAEKTREEFLRDLSLYASAEIEQRVQALLQRRLEGEPVAYLIGEWDFYGITFDVNPHVLIPRMDSEVLVERALSALEGKGEGTRVLDLCTGSGCIGLAVATHAKAIRGLLVDISDGALGVCKSNIRRCGLNSRVSAMKLDVLQAPHKALGEFDVITCNPPYITTQEVGELEPTVKDYEPHLALDGGQDGLDYYRYIAKAWKTVLKEGGTIFFEVGIGQAADVEHILAQEGYHSIETHADTAQIWRVVQGTK